MYSLDQYVKCRALNAVARPENIYTEESNQNKLVGTSDAACRDLVAAVQRQREIANTAYAARIHSEMISFP